MIGGRNFSIEFKSEVDNCSIKVGAWHFIPKNMFHEVFVTRDKEEIDKKIKDSLRTSTAPVLLYCHGNSNHRASPHRLQAYKMFQSLNFHVIAFDYRGYGDSTNIKPTERGVVEDALQTYKWLWEELKEAKEKPLIIFWGHSLGTAVAANMVSNIDTLCNDVLKEQIPPPDALILEAPFNNLMEEIVCHPLSKLVNWLPYYSNTFLKPFTNSSEYEFATDRHLTGATEMPILILHSKNDKIVPYELAVKLHEAVAASRRDYGAPLEFYSFEKGCGLGHNNMCESPEMKRVVRDFVSNVARLKRSNLEKKEKCVTF